MRNIVRHEHDSGYKGIFSKKRNFLHFLKKYIQADWLDNIDENDLILIDKSFIEADFKDRESDVIYKMKFHDSEVIFYILLELQSSVDYTMPFRLLKYMSELMKREFENTSKNKRESKDYRLPAVVPIILYNGADSWTAARSFREYLQGHEQFGEYIIDFKYFLFDLNRTTDEAILSTNKLLDMIFALDRKTSRANMQRMLNISAENLKRMSDEDKNDILKWLRYIWLNQIKDESVKDEMLNKFEKGEITNMMSGLGYIFEEERSKGEKKGEKKGKIETAIEMLKDSVDTITISKYTKLTVKEIEELKNQL